MYIRKDAKIIVAEIKYGTIPKNVRREVDDKVETFLLQNPRYKGYTFETLLISGREKEEANAFRDAFDYVISLEDLFREAE
jgi:hypothetical protein